MIPRQLQSEVWRALARLLNAVKAGASLGRRSEVAEQGISCEEDLLLKELQQQQRFSNTTPIVLYGVLVFKHSVYSLQEEIYRKFEATKTLLLSSDWPAIGRRHNFWIYPLISGDSELEKDVIFLALCLPRDQGIGSPCEKSPTHGMPCATQDGYAVNENCPASFFLVSPK
jgi:hypothetical protein